MKNIVSGLFFLTAFLLTSCKNNTATNEESKTTVNNSLSIAKGKVMAVDTKQSVINWTGSKPTGKHTGTINIKQGNITLKDGQIIKGDFILDMNSITVTDLKPTDGKEDLENHLKGITEKEKEDHFFNVKKYPTGKFVITRVAIENEKTIVYGNLSLKNITKAVNFPATIVVSDSLVTLESETLLINRTYWNINYASKTVFKNLADKFINDEVAIKVSVRATPK